MRLALFLTILLLSGYTTDLTATEMKNFPLAPAAQACLDAKPSASNDPEGFLRCLDILEVAAVDRWQAMRLAAHPETKACLDRSTSSADTVVPRRCVPLLDQEQAAMDRNIAFARLTKNKLIQRMLAHLKKWGGTVGRELSIGSPSAPMG